MLRKKEYSIENTEFLHAYTGTAIIVYTHNTIKIVKYYCKTFTYCNSYVTETIIVVEKIVAL